MKTFKTFLEDIALKDIVKREKESSFSGNEISSAVRKMTKEIKREKSDDIIVVHLSDDDEGVKRIKKDKLSVYLKKGWKKLK